jgi:hypothetical protein
MAVSPSNESTNAVAENAAIRPFQIEVPQDEIDELRRRAQATRWPDKETVSDRSQGVQLAKLRPLVEYWGSGYEWRKIEAMLNELPQFITKLDKGGHFAAWEQPQLFSEEVRAAFRSLR